MGIMMALYFKMNLLPILRKILIATSLACVGITFTAEATVPERDIFSAWREENTKAYSGHYVGQHRNSKGDDITAVLIVEASKSDAKAVFEFSELMSGNSLGSQKLTKVHVSQAGFEAEWPDSAKKSPFAPSHSLKGEFVFKSPRANAKGQIRKGLKFGESFYYFSKDND